MSLRLAASFLSPMANRYWVGGSGTWDAVNTANWSATSGNPAAGIPLLPGAVEILRFGPESYFSGVAASAQTIYITPGQGI